MLRSVFNSNTTVKFGPKPKDPFRRTLLDSSIGVVAVHPASRRWPHSRDCGADVCVVVALRRSSKGGQAVWRTVDEHPLLVRSAELLRVARGCMCSVTLGLCVSLLCVCVALVQLGCSRPAILSGWQPLREPAVYVAMHRCSVMQCGMACRLIVMECGMACGRIVIQCAIVVMLPARCCPL